MRVAHLVCSDGFAGVERFIATLAPALVPLGVEPTVIGGAEAPMRAALEPAGIAWLPAAGMAEARRRLASLPAPDVVNTHMSEADLVAALALRGRRRRIALVSTRHFAAPRGSGAFARAAFTRVSARLDAQIAISSFVAGSIDGPSDVIHTGVADRDDDGSRERRVLVVQRLESEKDTATALRAWAAARARESGWRMSVVGDGAERSLLEGLADELGIRDSVEFLGHRTDVDALLAGAGMVVAPTPREGLGILVLEAMAQATPVIASRGGGHVETIGAVTPELLFPPGDAAQAAILIDRLADDAEGRRRTGALLRARQREAFSIRAQAEATAALYRRVAGR